MASNSTKDFEVIIKELNELAKIDVAMRTAVSSVLAQQRKRIFQEGQAANGSKIGRYSTKPISISRRAQAVNTGKTYFKGGYAEYKREIGRNPGFVILRNTDQMMKDYSLVVIKKDSEYGLGFLNEFNFNKSVWMEDKYNKDIFAHSDQDDEKFFEALMSEVNRVIK